MAARAKQCPNCDALQPANAAEGVCPSCGMRQAKTEAQQPRAPATRPNPEANPRRPDAHTEGAALAQPRLGPKPPATGHPPPATSPAQPTTAGPRPASLAAPPSATSAKWARRKPTLAAAYTLGLLAALLGGMGGAAVRQWRAAALARDVEARARNNEAEARASAEKARDGEATAREAAQKARDREATAREALARVEYGRTIEAAHQEWRENRPRATQALLESTRPDLRGWEWRYVHRLRHSDLLTLRGATSQVNSALFSPDGSRIVTVDGEMYIDSSRKAERSARV